MNRIYLSISTHYRVILYFLTAFILLILITASSFSQGWYSLGTGSNNDVRCMAVYNAQLIVGGDFTSMGGISANRIASWNGINWQPLGLGTNGPDFRSDCFDGELIVAGYFTQVGGVAQANCKMERKQLAAFREQFQTFNNDILHLQFTITSFMLQVIYKIGGQQPQPNCSLGRGGMAVTWLRIQ